MPAFALSEIVLFVMLPAWVIGVPDGMQGGVASAGSASGRWFDGSLPQASVAARHKASDLM